MRAIITLALAITLSSSVLATPPGKEDMQSTDRGIMGLSKKLDLTQEQQKQVRDIFDGKKAKQEAIREQMKSLKEEIDQEIKAVLTDEQKAKFDEMMGQRSDKRQKQMMKGNKDDRQNRRDER